MRWSCVLSVAIRRERLCELAVSLAPLFPVIEHLRNRAARDVESREFVPIKKHSPDPVEFLNHLSVCHDLRVRPKPEPRKVANG